MCKGIYKYTWHHSCCRHGPRNMPFWQTICTTEWIPAFWLECSCEYIRNEGGRFSSMGTQHRTTLGTNCKNLRSNSRLCVVATIETLVLTHTHTHALIELLFGGSISANSWRGMAEWTGPCILKQLHLCGPILHNVVFWCVCTEACWRMEYVFQSEAWGNMCCCTLCRRGTLNAWYRPQWIYCN